MTGASQTLSPRLSESEFLQLRSLVNQRSGLAFTEDSRYLFERRLGERVSALGLPHFGAYIDLVEKGGTELDAVFAALTTKETYFFRQEYQLRALMDEVLPEVIRAQQGSRRLTIWSAGCSTGEEAYTLGMLLLTSPLVGGWQLRVIGTDLCRQNIEAAERGIYRNNSFRATEQHWLDEFFERQRDGSYQISGAVRRVCHFSQANLMNPEDLRSVGRVDVALCRNVIIYFDDASRAAVTKQLYQRLVPGGFLFLGHSESLLNADTPFEPVHLKGDLAYRRPLRSSPSGRFEL